VPGDRNCAVFRPAGPNRLIKLYTVSHTRKGARLPSTSSLYVYAFSPNMGLYGVALIGYCLMSNHVQLIAKMAMDPEIEETALVSGWVR
jgi:hypothetical protein